MPIYFGGMFYVAVFVTKFIRPIYFARIFYSVLFVSDWNIFRRSSDTMKVRLATSLNPLGLILLSCVGRFRGPQLGLYDAERRLSLELLRAWLLLDSGIRRHLMVFIFQSSSNERPRTQRNIFKILLNQPEIRLYLPFSDWFNKISKIFHCVRLYTVTLDT